MLAHMIVGIAGQKIEDETERKGDRVKNLLLGTGSIKVTALRL